MTNLGYQAKVFLLLTWLPLLTVAQNLASDRKLTQSSGLELELPNPAKSIHFIHDDLVLIQEASRFRFLLSDASNTGSAVLRTLPVQLPQAEFKGASPDGQTLIFEAGSSSEEISVHALRIGFLRSDVRRRGAPPNLVNERLMTPPSTLFWKPSRPPGYVGPGNSLRAEVISAFSTPRANESIEEYEPYECMLPPHSTNRSGPWVLEPTTTQVFEHRLRDRKGNGLVFFTSLDSRDVTYLTAREAALRGCEAGYERRQNTMLRSWDLARPLQYSSEYLVQLELLDAGVPARGVLVRLFEMRNVPSSIRPVSPMCGYPNAQQVLEPGPTDGLTLLDGSFVWRSERSRQRSGSARGQRSGGFDFTPNTVFAVLCMRTGEDWIPIWHSPRESMGYQLRCDLAKTSSVRCRKLPNTIQ